MQQVSTTTYEQQQYFYVFLKYIGIYWYIWITSATHDSIETFEKISPDSELSWTPSHDSRRISFQTPTMERNCFVGHHLKGVSKNLMARIFC